MRPGRSSSTRPSGTSDGSSTATFYEPLPGEWGVTPPMTIGAPVLVVNKSGPATMNLGQWGNFAIDVQNTGLGDAWNAAISDVLPDGRNGRHVRSDARDPERRVFAADGVTPVAGKGPLSQGTDYSLSYSGCAHLPARHDDADRRRQDRPERAPDRPLSDPARRGHAERHHAHQCRRRHPVVQRRQQQSRTAIPTSER